MHFQMILVCFKPFDRGLGIHAPFIQYQEDLFLWILLRETNAALKLPRFDGHLTL